MKPFLTLVAAILLLVACSNDAAVQDVSGGGAGASSPPAAGAGGASGGGAGLAGAGGPAGGAGAIGGAADGGKVLVAPEGLKVELKGTGMLDVVALTLQKGPAGADLYAAVKNVGDMPACSPAFSVELFDQAEQSLSAGVGGLLVRSFYRLLDAAGTVAGCVSPGDLAMIAMTDLPLDVAIENVDRVVYWYNYWVLDVVPIEGISITEVRAVSRGTGVAYAGVFVNGLDVAVGSPSVAVFPVAPGGRPLGAAKSRGTVEVPPGGRWEFETDTVSEPGVDFVAYPAGGA